MNPITATVLSNIPSRNLKLNFEVYARKLRDEIFREFQLGAKTLKKLADAIYFAINPLPKISLCPRPPSYQELGLPHRIPADTRAGLNDHSLFAHSCLTSVIATCIGFNKFDHNLLRVAGLLHDIGKLYGWEDHVPKGLKVIAPILDSTMPIYRDEVLRLVDKHHERRGPEKLDEKILCNADTWATKAERDIKFKFFGADAVEEDSPQYREKSQENVLRYQREFKSIRPKRKLDKSNEVVLFSTDARAIGHYVEGVKGLPYIRGGSFLVRNATEEIRNYFVEHFGPEFIIYSGGGNVQAILPALEDDELSRIERELRGKFEQVARGATIVCEWERFSIHDIALSFYECRDVLAQKLEMKKSKTISSYEIGPSEVLCGECGERVGSKTLLEGEEMRSVCEACYAKYRAGKSQAYRQREDIKEEFHTKLLAPGSLDELTADENAKHDDMAIIRADGNLTGAFFARALSPAHLSFMSFIVEAQTSGAVWHSMQKIEQKAIEQRHYLPFDIVYVGGDDILFIVSKKYALDCLQALCSKLEDGFKMTDGGLALAYAFSMVMSDYKYPLYEAFSFSKALLKRAKKRARKERNRTWVWSEAIRSANVTESDLDAYTKRFTARVKPEKLSSKPLTFQEIQEIREATGRLPKRRSSLFKVLEYCIRERPSILPYINYQTERVWGVEDAALIKKYVEEGKILDFMEIYELARG